MKNNLVLLRHGQSLWNQENLFTGWTDIDLSKKGIEEAKQAGILLKKNNLKFDICYTSYLKRAIDTLNYVLKEMDKEWVPVIKSWKLNERNYGALQGKNKAKTAEEFGEEQVKIWRRSYDVKPPKLDESDERNPAFQEMYENIPKGLLPLTESLEDTIKRVIPYFEQEIKPKLLAGENILITAHGNSLRSLAMYLENISKEDIIELNIPTGIPLVYSFNDDFSISNREYLGDSSAIATKIKNTANQGKKKNYETL